MQTPIEYIYNYLKRRKNERQAFEFVNQLTGGKIPTKQAVDIIQQIKQETDYLSRKDLQDWRDAWQMAIDKENPDRTTLYDIYQDALVDEHLIGIVMQRKLALILNKFIVIDADGKEDKDKTKLFQRGWFMKTLSLAFDSVLWGHSLIQFGNMALNPVTKVQEFKDVKLVPRKHVKPGKEIVVAKPTDKEGMSYTVPPFSDWCLPVGDPEDLGLLLSVSKSCISKKYALLFWDMFAEKFGIPLIYALSPTKDSAERSKIMDMLQSLGAAASGLFPTGTDLKIVESAKGDAYQVFDMRIARANSEMSKAILTQTMTVDNGSSKSQSEVHKDMFDIINMWDETVILNWIIEFLFPFLIMKGYPLEGFSGAWDKSKELDFKTQQEIDKWIIDTFDVDETYYETLSERYGAPITAKKESSVPDITDPAANTGNDAAVKKKDNKAVAYLTRYINALYFTHVCDKGLKNALPKKSNDRIQSLQDEVTQKLFNGEIPKGGIALELYQEIAGMLMGAATSDIKPGIDYDTPDNAMIAAIRANVFGFSGAKNRQQMEELRDMLIDENGKIKAFSQYKNDVKAVYDKYNATWLEAEYNHAVASGQMASRWLQIQQDKDVYKLLRYETIKDERVRPQHAALQGITKPVDDPFWRNWYPPNGWNCRCDVSQHIDGKITTEQQVGETVKGMKRQDMFKNNVGETGAVFPDGQSYFQFTDPNKLSATGNYGLKEPKEFYVDPSKLPQKAEPLKDENDYRDWWDSMVKKYKGKDGAFAVKDINGDRILFNDVNHILAKPEEKRYEYSNNIIDVVTNPDEVYDTLKDGKLNRIYIKYYNDMPFVIAINNKDKKLTAVTWYMYDRPIQKLNEIRKGALIFVKRKSAK